MVNSGHLANPVSQRGALLQWTLLSLATCGTAMKKQNNHQNLKNTNEKQLFLKTCNGNIGVLDNSVLLRLRKVTAMRQLKADHSLTVKATKPKI